MRFSVVSSALYGVVAVSAGRISARHAVQRRNDTGGGVDLSQFGSGFHKVSLSQAMAEAATPDVFNASQVQTNKADSDVVTADDACTSPSTRIEWRNMADADKANFIAAARCLLNKPSAGGFTGSTNRHEDLVVVHQQMTGSIHMVAQFTPWHRLFLNAYFELLKSECGYGGPFPWWDETKDEGNFANSPLFTDAYYGSAPLKTSSGQGTCVTNGAFANLVLHIGPGSGNSNHCLSRALDESLTAQCNQNFLNTCASHSNYSDYESCLEYGPHAYGHDGIGAVMSEVSASPGDPVFFMHHTFVDHAWWAWQEADTANRLYQVDGYDTNPSNSNDILTLSYVLKTMGLTPDTTVQQVMDTQGGTLCYNYDY